MIDVDSIRQRFSAVAPFLDERGRRVVAAAEARAAGYGGIAAVSAVTGVAASTIGRGLRDLCETQATRQVRRAGGGRKANVVKDPTLLSALGALVEPSAVRPIRSAGGDPQSSLRWTCKSLRRLADELQTQGHQASHTLVGELLDGMGFSLQGNRKTQEGDDHPDRDAQFQYINAAASAALAENEPVISVDTKKKELVGNGRAARPDSRMAGANIVRPAIPKRSECTTRRLRQATS